MMELNPKLITLVTMKEPDDLDDAIKAAELASTEEDFTRIAKKEANLAE